VVLKGKGEGELICRWVGSKPRGWNVWKLGSIIGLVGEIQMEEKLELVNSEPVGIDGRGSGMLPVYQWDGIEDRKIRDIIAEALLYVCEHIQDSLPKDIIEKASLLTYGDALRDAHFPANQSNKGRNRLIFEEVFLFHIGRRLQSKLKQHQGWHNSIKHDSVGALSLHKQINLNDEQEIAFTDIKRDLMIQRPMRRLIQGDVGTGKALVALLSTIIIAEQGNVAVYICNDLLSAERRFLFAEPLLKSVSIQCVLLNSRPNRAQMDVLKQEGGVVFGTINVLEGKPNIQPRMIVVEESMNFGGNIPTKHLKNTPSPDLLVLTPMPQPMSILETVYADLDISMILTSNIIHPQCSFLTSDFRSEAYKDVLDHIKEGHQAFIALPVRDGKDLLGVKDALNMASAIQAEFLPEIRIGVYCSEMSKDERHRVFDDFQRRRIDVLLCTTFIEEAPSLGNVSVMVVEMAEKHSLTRLHRLRSHLGHSHYPATCRFVLSNNPTEEDIDMISLVCREHSGFRLAEEDEQIRGFSSLSSLEVTRGDFQWIGNGKNERQIRMKARDLARTISTKDIERSRWPLLNNAAQKRWGTVFDIPLQSRNQKRYRKRRRR
jgi:ATP-dependent DNA helicase RecG